MIGKAISTGQLAPLKKVGIAVSEAEMAQFKHATQTEKVAMMNKILGANVGKVNEELAKTDLTYKKYPTTNILTGEFQGYPFEGWTKEEMNFMFAVLSKAKEKGTDLIENALCDEKLNNKTVIYLGFKPFNCTSSNFGSWVKSIGLFENSFIEIVY